MQVAAVRALMPTYWHFHLHSVHVDVEISHGAAIAKAHPFDNIITNLELVSDYYLLCNLNLVLGEHDPLYEAWQAARTSLDSTVQS